MNAQVSSLLRGGGIEPRGQNLTLVLPFPFGVIVVHFFLARHLRIFGLAFALDAPAQEDVILPESERRTLLQLDVLSMPEYGGRIPFVFRVVHAHPTPYPVRGMLE